MHFQTGVFDLLKIFMFTYESLSRFLSPIQTQNHDNRRVFFHSTNHQIRDGFFWLQADTSQIWYQPLNRVAPRVFILRGQICPSTFSRVSVYRGRAVIEIETFLIDGSPDGIKHTKAKNKRRCAEIYSSLWPPPFGLLLRCEATTRSSALKTGLRCQAVTGFFYCSKFYKT